MSLQLLLFALSIAAPTGQLHLRPIAATSSVPSTLIIGRAVCLGATWLLTEHGELVAISQATREAAVRPVKGLQSSDRPWGLACLTDGTLWTLATPRTLARISAEGTIRDRIELRFPRLVIFGWNDRLLFIQLPVLIAKPLLASAPPRAMAEPAPWPRFIGRATESRVDLLARNLVNCGIGHGRNLPCWFADERRATVSDGSTASTVTFAGLNGRDVDAAAPIWDLALGGADSMWLVSSAARPVRGHTVGGRLVKTNGAGIEQASIVLTPPARIILSATDTACLLLTVDGRLMEVIKQ